MKKLSKNTIKISKELYNIFLKTDCNNEENTNNHEDLLQICCMQYNHAIDSRYISDATKPQVWKISTKISKLDSSGTFISMFFLDDYLLDGYILDDSEPFVIDYYHKVIFNFNDLIMKFENNYLSLHKNPNRKFDSFSLGCKIIGFKR